MLMRCALSMRQDDEEYVMRLFKSDWTLSAEQWAVPLPVAHLISPGQAASHAGVN